MEVFTHYGIGTQAFAIERTPDGRVEFTLWATAFFLPLWPLSSWSAIYSGEVGPDGIKEYRHSFYDEAPIERDSLCYLRTWTASLVVVAIAMAPIAYLILRTTGRGATDIEAVLMLVSCVWPVVVVILVERRRRKVLAGART